MQTIKDTFGKFMGDLKAVGMLPGQQAKVSCFICEWDSRAEDQHWKSTE